MISVLFLDFERFDTASDSKIGREAWKTTLTNFSRVDNTCLFTGQITIPWMSVDKTNHAIHYMCYPVNSVSNKYGLLTKCEVKMAGYWPSSFFACLWTETKSRSINSQKKNEANIQPS